MWNNDDLMLWKNITFEIKGFRKNFDFIFENDNFITEYDGQISKLRINEDKLPIPIGEFGISVWNIKFANEFNVDLFKELKNYKLGDSHRELSYLISNNQFPFKNINKLVILHTLIIHPDYRKRGVTEEFVEFLYRDFGYDQNNLLIALVKPIQNNIIDRDFFWNKKRVMYQESVRGKSIAISGKDYYKLDDLLNNTDNEIIEYKLFSVASKCGFKRINESHIFYFDSNIIKKRLTKKRNSTINVKIL